MGNIHVYQAPVYISVWFIEMYNIIISHLHDHDYNVDYASWNINKKQLRLPPRPEIMDFSSLISKTFFFFLSL